MKFEHIDDINKFILLMQSNRNEESQWYEDLDWFSSNKYTTSSEYFGELMLFIEKLILAEDMEKYKPDLIELNKKLKSLF